MIQVKANRINPTPKNVVPNTTFIKFKFLATKFIGDFAFLFWFLDLLVAKAAVIRS